MSAIHIPFHNLLKARRCCAGRLNTNIMHCNGVYRPLEMRLIHHSYHRITTGITRPLPVTFGHSFINKYIAQIFDTRFTSINTTDTSSSRPNDITRTKRSGKNVFARASNGEPSVQARRYHAARGRRDGIDRGYRARNDPMAAMTITAADDRLAEAGRGTDGLPSPRFWARVWVRRREP